METLVLGSSFYNEFILLGSILALDEKIDLNGIKSYVSVSTSSIISLLLSLDFKLYDIITFFHKNKIFISLSDIIENKIENKFQTLKIKAKLSELIMSKINIIPTMHELYVMTGKKLYFLVQKDNELDFISFESTPSMKCIDAILHSICSVGLYTIPNSTQELFDATLQNPFPIEFLEEKDKSVGIYLHPQLQLTSNKDIIIQTLINSKLNDIVSKNVYCQIYQSKIFTRKDKDFIQDLIDGYLNFKSI